MAKDNLDSDKLAALLKRQDTGDALKYKWGNVVSMDAGMVNVRISGFQSLVSCHNWAGAGIGDVVGVICKGTKWFAIASNSGGDTMPIANFPIEASVNKNPAVGWVWEKYADGTARCWKWKEISIPVNVPWIQVYTSASIPAENFPLTFIEPPVGRPEPVDSARFWTISNLTTTTNTGVYYLVSGNTYPSSGIVRIQFEYVGRWSVSPVLPLPAAVKYQPDLYSQGVLLYNNPSATAALNNIVLLDTIANYDYLEIEYGWGSGGYSTVHMQKVPVRAATLNVGLSFFRSATNNRISQTKYVSITGNTISWASGANGRIMANPGFASDDVNEIIIYKVIGYRNMQIPPISIIDPGAFVYRTYKQDTGRRTDEGYVIWGQLFRGNITAAVNQLVEITLVSGLPANGQFLDGKGWWVWDVNVAGNTMPIPNNWGANSPYWSSFIRRGSTGAISFATQTPSVRTNAAYEVKLDWTDGTKATL